MIFTGLILTAWGQHDTDLNNLAYKTRCDSTLADAALRVGVESRRSFARWMVFLMLLIVFYFGLAGPVQRKPQHKGRSNFFRVSGERPTTRTKRSGGMRRDFHRLDFDRLKAQLI